MLLAATFLNAMYSYSERYTIIWYTPLHTWPANQPTITVVAVCKNTFDTPALCTLI